MDFAYYFLKEGTSNYIKTELITYLVANPNITPPDETSDALDKVYTYKHPVLGFEAFFVMSDRNVIPHLDRISAKYFDVHFYVHFDILLSNYAVEMILDIVDDITKRFRFLTYNQAFPDVIPFRRPMMIKAFDSWKKAYAARNPEVVSKYSYLDPLSYSSVLNYMQKQKRLELTLEDQRVSVSKYTFYKAEKSRTAFIAIKWDGYSAFVLPPAVDILVLEDSKTVKFVAISELMLKAKKLFTIIDGYGDISILDNANTKKLYKILTKEKFAPLSVKLEELTLNNILDI